MKKVYLFLLSILIIIFFIFGIPYLKKYERKPICKPIETGEKLFLVKDDNKYKFVNSDGEVKITTFYKDVKPFNEDGISIIKSKNGLDMMDQNCNLKTNYKYNDIYEFIYPEFYYTKLNDKEIVFNKEGEELYTFSRFSRLLTGQDKTQFEGYLEIDNKEYMGLYQYKDGEIIEVLKPEYPYAEFIEAPEKQGMYIYYEDIKNKVLKDFQGTKYIFDDIVLGSKAFEHEIAFVKKNDKWAIFNRYGELLTDYVYQDVMMPEFKDIAVVRKNDKWGVIDLKGNLLIDYIYDEVILYDEFLGVKKGNYYTYLDINLHEISDFKYTEISPFTDGVAKVEWYSKPLLIDNNGNELTKKYDELGNFYHGYALVRKDGKYGFIDTSGIEKIDVKYDDLYTGIGVDKKNMHFQNTGVVVKSNDHWGYVDNNGNQITDFIYQSIIPISTIYAAVTKDNEKWAILNLKTGEELTDFIYTKIYNYMGDGVFEVYCDREPDCREKISLKDKHEYDLVLQINTDLFKYSYNQKYGLINSFGTKITEPIYGSMKYILDSHIIVEKDGKFGMIDFEGNEITPFRYEELFYDAYDNNNNLYVKLNGKVGFIDFHGNEIIPIKYDAISRIVSYDDQILYTVKLNGKWGIINEKNETIIDFTYDELDIRTTNYILVKLNDKWGIINSTNEKIIDLEYDDIEIVSDYIKVKTKGNWGLYDLDGNVVLKPKYDNIII